MDTYHIYNKSSENMSECSDATVDLIIAGPPYNIGTLYGENSDSLSFSDYKKLINNIVRECYRVLKTDGVMLVEASDSVLMDGLYVQLSGLIQSICLQHGFLLRERHLNFVHSQDGVELPEDSRWNEDYSTKINAHSNIHQWMVFVKKPTEFQNGEVYYLDYIETKEHPCPFPEQTCNIFLSKYYKEGMTVLDPFMGTANLGKKVIEQGGTYIGYEIDQNIFDEAKNKLAGVSGDQFQ